MRQNNLFKGVSKETLTILALILILSLVFIGLCAISNQYTGVPYYDEEMEQEQMCSTLCNNIGEDYRYYGVILKDELYQCYCARTYTTGDDNNTFKITIVNSYGFILEVVKIENQTNYE